MRKVWRPPEHAADDTHLPVGVGKALNVVPRRHSVGDDVFVVSAALASRMRRNVLRSAVSEVIEEVGANGSVAVMGELTGELLVDLIPAGDVVHQHHGREGAGPHRAGEIGVYAVAVVPLKGDGFGNHAFVHISCVHGVDPF